MIGTIMVNGNELSSETLRSKMKLYDLPEYMVEGMINYLFHRIPPGSFMCAVLTNDLSGAVQQADDLNIHCIPNYIKFLYNEVPGNCWGGVEKVESWLKKREIK